MNYKKFSKLIILTLSLIIVLGLAACGKSTEPTENRNEENSIQSQNADEAKATEDTFVDMKITYQMILETIDMLISGKTDNGDINGNMGITLELSNIKAGYVNLGYLLYDLNNDGTDELLIGVNPTEIFDEWAGQIYMIYTCIDDSATLVTNGWSRNYYYLCQDGTLANISFSDGFSRGYSFYAFDGKKLNLIESVIRKQMYDDMTQKEAVHWLYSESLTYEEHDNTEKYDLIDEERAKDIIGKYKYMYLDFIPISPLG